jgi:prepilin-type N-terminal cleavage/methylation domain-containing protein
MRRADVRKGFTLLEITLVLTLLAIVAAMSWPVFGSWLQSHRVGQGIDQVQTLWAKGRTHAMKEGRIYRFSWGVNSNHYRLAPDGAEYWGSQVGTDVVPRSSRSDFGYGTIAEAMLPPGVQFFANLMGANAPVGGLSSAPDTVLLCPDGTAKIFTAEGMERSETYLYLGTAKGKVRVLQLRGVTGGASVVHLGGAVR